MKRFDIDCGVDGFMNERPDGDFTLYSDHQAHMEKSVALAHDLQLRSQLQNSEDDLIWIATMQDHLTFQRERIIRRRVGWTDALDKLESQIDQPE